MRKVASFDDLDADEMFDALGYSKYENHPKNENLCENMFTTQDNPVIEYTAENENAIEKISFDLWGRNVIFHGYLKGLKKNVPCPVDMKELCAIFKKCKELGFISD